MKKIIYSLVAMLVILMFVLNLLPVAETTETLNIFQEIHILMVDIFQKFFIDLPGLLILIVLILVFEFINRKRY